MSSTTILTVAGRWKQAAEATGITKHLSKREQVLAMLMFYAGFAACLEAATEVTDLSEEEGMQMLAAMHREVQTVTASAEMIFKGGTKQ